MSAAECPSLFSILPLIEYGFGVWHPKGGCGQLMQSLADLFVRMGGTIRLDSPVSGLVLEGTKCDGVVLQDGSEHRHDHVVVNADAAWAINNLMPSHIRGAWGRRRTTKAKYSCSTAMLYLGVEGEVDLPHHTIRVAEDYEQNLHDISRDNGRSGVVSEDPSFYVQSFRHRRFDGPRWMQFAVHLDSHAQSKEWFGLVGRAPRAAAESSGHPHQRIRH